MLELPIVLPEVLADDELRGEGAAPGAALEFAFDRQRAFKRGNEAFLPRLLDTTRASSKWAEKSDGSLIEVGANVAALTDKGLLVEPSATNILIYSKSLSVGYTFTRCTRVTGEPDVFGGSDAIEVVCNGQSDPLVAQSASTGDPSGKTYTMSIWAKVKETPGGETPKFSFYAYGDTGVENVKSASRSITATLTRYTFTFTFAAGMVSTSCTFRIDPFDGEVPSNGASIVFCGFQVEEGSVATSFIETTGASATRSHDRIITDISGLDLSQGVYGRWTGELLDGGENYRRLLTFYESSDNRSFFLFANGKLELQSVKLGLITAAVSGNWLAGAHEIVFGFGPNFIQGVFDGVASTVDTVADRYNGGVFTDLALGTNETGTDSNASNALHQSLTLYAGTPTTAKLQALVTV